MAAPKKTAREMKDTLRYKHMVARLKGLKPYKKGAALLQEIAKGSQWRIDAALEAIAPQDWQQIDVGAVLNNAALFGRLQTVEKIADTLGFEKGGRPTLEIQAAFHVASRHGNYKTADALAARGAHPDFFLKDTPPAVLTAIAESDVRKVNYLLKKGANPDFMLYVATVQENAKIARHLIEKKGADALAEVANGDTAIKAAERGGNAEILSLLQASVKQPEITQLQPAVTDAQLKGTKFETSFDAAHLAMLKDTLKIPEVIPDFRDALKSVARTERGLDLTLQNGKHLEWKAASEGARAFIGRDSREGFDDNDAKVTVAGAAALGWKSIKVHGDKAQQEALWLEAQRRDITVLNFTPDDDSDVKKRWDVEEAARKKAQSAKPPGPSSPKM